MGLSADEALYPDAYVEYWCIMRVHACAQADKPYYHTIMKQIVENQENLDTEQLMIDKVLYVSHGGVVAGRETGEVFEAQMRHTGNSYLSAW